jgi:ribonuclease P protein component
MFSQKQRLNTSDFEEVFNFGKKIYSPLFILKYKENLLEQGRFGFSFSKKKFKGAVERHLLKRKVSHILKETKLNKMPKDFVFIFNEKIREIKKEELALLINNLRLE